MQEVAIEEARDSDWETIKDDGMYVMNPLFRLRNERDHVKLYGAHDRGEYDLHHTLGILLALCNGKRTVRDVAQAVVPFVDDPQAEDPLPKALHTVKDTISYFLKTEDEQNGDEPKPDDDDLPSSAALIPSSLLPEFGRLLAPEYDPRLFLPEHAPKPPEKRYPFKERAPLRLNWHLTSDCAVNCRYCYLKRRRIPRSKLLPFKRALEVIEECKAIGVLHIEPGGGDVLLYPHLFEFLEALEGHSFSPIKICTKAFCSKEMASRLSEYYVTCLGVQFSMDSTIPEVADYLTATPGFCRKSLESIDNALEAGLRVTVKTVITPYNILTVPRLYRELRRRGVHKVLLATYSRSGHHHTDDLFNHPETFKELESQLDILRKEFPDDLMNIQNGRPESGPPLKEDLEASWPERSRCTAGRMHMMVCADGKVIPCEQMREIEENFCGDLNTQSIQDIWNSTELIERTTDLPREKFKGLACFECEEYEHCVNFMGYCTRDTDQFFGSIYATPDNCPKCEHPWVRTL